MNTKEYYTAPKQEIFENIKAASIQIWQIYDNEFGYVDEKVNQIKDIKNIRDNTCFIVAMFDQKNQYKLYRMFEAGETKEWLERLFEGNLDNALDEMYP